MSAGGDIIDSTRDRVTSIESLAAAAYVFPRSDPNARVHIDVSTCA